MHVLGIMSGTSIDAVDYALCEVSGSSIQLREFWTAKYPRELQERLHEAARGGGTSHTLAQLHHDAGRFFARHATRGKHRAQLAGLHGQTIFHQPRRPHPATFQLGEPAYLVEALQAPVVSNFRAADLAAGGEGAPLATAFHLRVFGKRGKHVCVQNLGGIGNVTSIDWRKGTKPKVLSFDTGPANVLLDLAARYFTGGKLLMDRNGAMAREGRCVEALLKEWLKDSFFRKAPPKSTGREYFGEPFFQKVIKAAEQMRISANDMLATLTEFTAQTVATNYRLHLPGWPQQVIVAGGGAKNPELLRRLKEALAEAGKEIEVSTTQALGWPSSAIEPAAFAWLAFLRVNSRVGNLPETTGAHRAALLGQVSEP